MKLSREIIRTISEALCKEQEKRGVTVEQFAKELEISVPTLKVAKDGTMPVWLAEHLVKKLNLKI